MLERARQRGEQAIVGGGDDDHAGLRLESLERHQPHAARRMTPGDLAGDAIAGELAGVPGQGRLEQRGVDDAAETGLGAPQQRGEDADDGPHAAADVERRHADAKRRRAFGPAHPEQAGERLHHRLVAGPVLQRADRPERAERAVDQARVERAERLGAQPELFQRARSHVLEHDVDAAHVLLEPGHVARVLQIERDRALAGVDAVEARADAGQERRPPAARVVAPVRPLDLDDIGPQPSQRLAGERPGQVLRELEDLDAGERKGCHRVGDRSTHMR